MAEAYLRHFGNGHLEACSAGFEPRDVHPLAVAVMQADNIDISRAESKDLALFSGEQFDYVITVCDYAETHLPSDIVADHQLHYSIPDPEAANGSEEEILEVFCDVREQVKRSMLQVVGQLLDLGLPA
jgi:arsenate reductase